MARNLNDIFSGNDQYLEKVVILPRGTTTDGTYTLPTGYTWSDFDTVHVETSSDTNGSNQISQSDDFVPVDGWRVFVRTFANSGTFIFSGQIEYTTNNTFTITTQGGTGGMGVKYMVGYVRKLTPVEGIRENINENILINGCMRVDQRGANTTASGAYSLDQWRTGAASGAINVQQSQTTYDADGFVFSNKAILRFDTTAIGTEHSIHQRIEANDDLKAGGTFTLSFKARGLGNDNLPIKELTFGHFENGARATTTYIANDIVLGAQGIWAEYSFTFQVPKYEGVNTDFSWHDIRIQFGGAQISTYDLTDVKLERGDVATAFIADDPQVNLEKCLRYFQRGNMRGHVSSAGNYVGANSTLPVMMRDIPSIVWGRSNSQYDNVVLTSGNIPRTVAAGGMGANGVNGFCTGVYLDAVLTSTADESWCFVAYQLSAEF